MSLNKFMHPRNKYRKPPDFKALAIKYPEFRKYAKQDISGKVSLDFKDLEAIRALTRTLLLEDFSLDVEIPLSRLIPTLPLRLNYLLWIEDLLESNKRTTDVKGIDIGCGASCVYPLLAAKKFGWRMLATEVDMESAFIAGRNIKKNKLQDMIKVRSVEEGQMLDGVLEPDTTYDFCMCNPPFFSSTEELDPKNVSRSLKRPAPRNAHSGTTTELVVPGGEMAFIAGIIRDSNKLKVLIRIYSVMVGHKTSVEKVKQALQEAGIAAASIVTTEFCQGRTTRWGIAWTLDPSILLPQPVNVPKKKTATFQHVFQSDLDSTVDRLRKLLEELKITYTVLKYNKDLCAMEITALENTWSQSRKKRRLEKLKQKMSESSENCKDNTEAKPKENGKVYEGNISEDKNKGTVCNQNKAFKENETKMAEAADSESAISDQDKQNENETKMAEAANSESAISDQDKQNENEIKTAEAANSESAIISDQDKQNENETKMAEAAGLDSEIISDQGSQKGSKRSINEVGECSGTDDVDIIKKPKLEIATPSSSSDVQCKKLPILHGSLVLKKSCNECSVDITWLRGAGGVDSAHQVLQYFKNNFKPHQAINE